MTDEPKAAKIVAKKSYRDGYVAIGVVLKCSGFGDSAKITGVTDLTTEQARDLAQSIIRLADQADAKIAAKSTETDRRQKWYDREVAAGRMVVWGGFR